MIGEVGVMSQVLVCWCAGVQVYQKQQSFKVQTRQSANQQTWQSGQKSPEEKRV